jgi:hypothetical protein
MLAFPFVTNRGDLTLGAVLLLAACSNNPTTAGTGTSPSSTPAVGGAATPSATGGTGATPAAPAGTSSASGGSSAPTGASASAGKSGGSTPTASAAGSTATAAAGVMAAATAGMSASAAGNTAVAGAGGGSAPGSAVTLEDCVTSFDSSLKTDAPKKCKSFTTLPPQMTKVDLGPYGATSEYNVGKDFAIDASTDPGESGCAGFADIFGEDPRQTQKLLQTEDLDFGLYSIYYPAIMPEGKLPIITWGNGTCAQPEGYGALLRYVVSYGYFIVAANNRSVGQTDGKSGKMPMSRALDFAFALNDDMSSPFYQKLDTTNVGAMGHSQGGMATITAAGDDRVKSVIIWNGGNGAKKPWLSVSADLDVFTTSPADMDSTSKSQPPSAWLYYHNPAGMGGIRGHLTLMMEPQRVDQQAVAWWDMMLKGSADAKATFVDSTCKWCGHKDDMADSYEFGANGL